MNEQSYPIVYVFRPLLLFVEKKIEIIKTFLSLLKYYTILLKSNPFSIVNPIYVLSGNLIAFIYHIIPSSE